MTDFDVKRYKQFIGQMADPAHDAETSLGLSGVQNTYQVAGAVLSSGRTLTERVQALEKAVEKLASDTAKRLDALETKVRSGK